MPCAPRPRRLRAELEELRLQLDPHFLFNALNGVAEEIPEHPAAALAMLRDIAAYLRHSLDGINQTVVTVEFEVAGLAAYLGVQKARFGERLKASIDVTPDAAHAASRASCCSRWWRMPSSTAGARTVLTVRVDIRAEGETLHVEIENTGTLEAAERRAPAPSRASVSRTCAGGSPCTILRVTHFTLGSGRNTVIATLVLEGEPCSGS